MKKIQNENYFSNMSKNSLYWAGFLMADGCIYNGALKLALAEKDKDHIVKLQSDLQSSYAMIKNISKNSKRNPNWKDSVCYHVSICSKQLTSDLETFGVIPNKTFDSKITDLVKHSAHIRHFCRGYFDGDGTISLHKPSTRKMNPQLVVAIRGSVEFLTDFNRALVMHAGLPDRCLKKKINTSSSIGNLLFNGNNICKQILTWLYSDLNESDRFLDRKYQLACKYI